MSVFHGKVKVRARLETKFPARFNARTHFHSNKEAGFGAGVAEKAHRMVEKCVPLVCPKNIYFLRITFPPAALFSLYLFTR